MTARGEQHGRAKLTIWEVVAIRLVLAEPEPPSVSAVARAFAVDRRTVQRVRDGKRWGWVG